MPIKWPGPFVKRSNSNKVHSRSQDNSFVAKKKDFMPFRLVPKDVVYLIIYSILRHIIVFPHELKYPLLFSRELIQDSFYNTILIRISPRFSSFRPSWSCLQPNAAFYGRFWPYLGWILGFITFLADYEIALARAISFHWTYAISTLIICFIIFSVRSPTQTPTQK